MWASSCSRVTTAQTVGSAASTLAERGPPSSAISPTYSPGPYRPSVSSLPLASATKARSRPARTMYRVSPRSPSWMMSVPRR